MNRPASRNSAKAASCTVSDYLIQRLSEFHIRHVFGVPGDFILPFFMSLQGSPVQHIGTCNELNAGYAADGYARLNGMGAVAATYGPGAFSLVNAVAGAYAERVPLVVISGGPRAEAYGDQLRLHHLLPGNCGASLEIFGQVTGAAEVIGSARHARRQIDQLLLRCWQSKRPVYLEIPADIQAAECRRPDSPLNLLALQTQPELLELVLGQLVEAIESGERVCLLPGHEIHRFGLQEKIIELCELTGLPVATLFIGKADYLEHLPACIGAYQGAASTDGVRRYVEESDTLILPGAVESDFNLGGFSHDFSGCREFWLRDDEAITPRGNYSQAYLPDIIDALVAHFRRAPVQNRAREFPVEWTYPSGKPSRLATEPVSDGYFFDQLASFIRPGDVLAVDGGALINSPYLRMPVGARVLGSGYWASIGAGFGMGVGGRFAMEEHQRLIAVVGDGSFQMVAQEISSFARYNRQAIVFVLNNRGYTAERVIHDGPFNDIADWRYHKLSEPFGGHGVEVRTVAELNAALVQAAEYAEMPGSVRGAYIVEVHLDPFDVSEPFRRLASTLK